MWLDVCVPVCVCLCVCRAQGALPEEKYENYKKALIDRKLQPDSQMSEESDRHWGEIKSRR